MVQTLLLELKHILSFPSNSWHCAIILHCGSGIKTGNNYDVHCKSIGFGVSIHNEMLNQSNIQSFAFFPCPHRHKNPPHRMTEKNLIK